MRPYCGQIVKGPGVTLLVKGRGVSGSKMSFRCMSVSLSEPSARFRRSRFAARKPCSFRAAFHRVSGKPPVKKLRDMRPQVAYEKPFPFSLRTFRRAAEAENISDEGEYQEAGDIALSSTPAVPQIEMSIQMLMDGRGLDWQPGGVAVMYDGRITITDMDNDCLRISIISPTKGLYLIFYLPCKNIS